MNSQKIILLAIVAGAMVFWAGSLTMKSESSSSQSSVAAELIQGLDPTAIGTIEISKDTDKVVLKRQGNSFVATNKENYPASTKEINSLITQCLDIKVDKKYSSNAKNHEDLGVTLDKAKTIIRFAKADGSPLTGLVVGDSLEKGQGSYVRRVDSNDVYVAEDVPWFQSGVINYLDKELITADRESIISVSIIPPQEDVNDTAYTVMRDEKDNANIVLQDMPPKTKLQTNMARSVLTALSGLQFEDVSRVADPNALFNRFFVVALKNGTVYTLKVAKANEKTYVQAAAAYTGGDVTIDPHGKDDEAALKEKQDKLKAQENAKEFTAKHQGWIYQIPDYKGQYLTKPLADLLEPLPDPEPEKLPSVQPNDVDAVPNVVEEAMDAVMN